VEGGGRSEETVRGRMAYKRGFGGRGAGGQEGETGVKNGRYGGGQEKFCSQRP